MGGDLSVRALWPREHGAYVQLGVPIAAALCLQSPSVISMLLAVGACLAFLANEPLVILLGHRGARRHDELHDVAVRRLALTSVGAALAGGAGLWQGTSTTLAVTGLVALPGALMLWASWRRSAHSMTGELLAAVALPGASAPVAVASGAPWETGLQLWLAWSLGYVASVIAVHRVLARRRAPTRRDLVRIAILVALTLACLAFASVVRELAVAVPLAAASSVVAVRSPSPRQLRAIGVALVAASLVSASLTVLIL